MGKRPTRQQTNASGESQPSSRYRSSGNAKMPEPTIALRPRHVMSKRVRERRITIGASSHVVGPEVAFLQLPLLRARPDHGIRRLDLVARADDRGLHAIGAGCQSHAVPTKYMALARGGIALAGAVDLQLHDARVGIHFDVDGLAAARVEAPPRDVDHGRRAPVGLIEVEGVLLGLPIVA